MTQPITTSTRRGLALFAGGVAAFTIYGSLVPFEFRARPWSDVVDSFVWAMTRRPLPESRSDGLANVMLGLPLGFALLGLVCGGNTSRLRAVGLGVLVLPLCTAFAATVEFAQLFVPSRTCAGSDVVAQTLGAAAGMAAWVAVGPRLMRQVHAVWVGGRLGGVGGRVLVAYLVLLTFVQTLPLDLTASPADLYRKFRDGHVRFVPFGEFGELAGDRAWARVATLIGVVGLYLPVGLLAATLPRRFGWVDSLPRFFLTAVVVAVGLEAVQLVVKSRTPSATDVVVGSLAAAVGWLLGRTRLSLEAALVLGQVWAAVVLIGAWQPFDFRGPPAAFDWIPGLPLEYGNPLFSLEEVITKLALFAPFGVLVAVAGLSRLRFLLASAIGGGVAAVGEIGQLFLASHTPCITDVVIGSAGAVCGAWVTARVRATQERVEMVSCPL